MQIVDVQVTLTGSVQPLSAITGLTAYDRCSRIRISPDSANTHVINVLGPNGVQLKQIAKPTAADTVQDEFVLDMTSLQNVVEIAQVSIKGTNTEKANINLYIL